MLDISVTYGTTTLHVIFNADTTSYILLNVIRMKLIVSQEVFMKLIVEQHACNYKSASDKKMVSY